MIPADALSRRQLLAKIRKLTAELEVMEAGEEALDELVRDCASEQATEVNNNGLRGQLEYLLRNGWKPEDILGRIKNNA